MKNMMKIEKLIETMEKELKMSDIIIHVGKLQSHPDGFAFIRGNGEYLEVHLYKADEDAPEQGIEYMYKSFVIGPDRKIYRYKSSTFIGDDQVSVYRIGNLGGFTATETLYIVNLMNYVEEG